MQIQMASRHRNPSAKMDSIDMQKDVKPYFAQNTLQSGLHGYNTSQAKSLKHDTQKSASKEQAIYVLNGAPLGLSPGQVLENPSTRPGSAPQIGRQFWSAGDCEAAGSSKCLLNAAAHGRMCVHPKFLHSNATSHTWPFGAIAELFDNAVDEVQNGGTKVIVDKVINRRNGSLALLIQDDGGGMDPDSLRRCMSFGFSDKQSDSSIGQYGNGFKTSTMRLGSDVIVFSRCMKSSSEPSQSIGLLSYTFLTETGQQDVIVPVVDYKYNPLTGETKRSGRGGPGHFSSNLSALLQWSPFPTEEELLQNFNDIGQRGTKIIVFNLWSNDDGDLELDFNTNEEDIMISGAPKPGETNNAARNLNQKHLANQLRYSLRVYASVLYLRLPEYFRIILRGQEVKRRSIASDLRYCECIKYKPQISGKNETEVLTTIGFVDGAPNIIVQGFNIYHKNRLILPFHRVLSSANSKGKGVVGVLEANFIKPTHDKQGFEKSSLYQRLETRLKEMTNEYWDHHCHLFGYIRPTRATSVASARPALPLTVNTIAIPSQRNLVAPSPAIPIAPFVKPMGHAPHLCALPIMVNTGAAPSDAVPVTNAAPLRAVPAAMNTGTSAALPMSYSMPVMRPKIEPASSPAVGPSTDLEATRKRKNESSLQIALYKKHATHGPSTDDSSNFDNQVVQYAGERELNQFAYMEEENRKLRKECLLFEEAEEELLLKEQKLRFEIEQAERAYKNLLNECLTLVVVKIEKQ